MPTQPAPAAAPLANARPPDPGPWSGFAMRGLRNQVLCAGIALILWAASSGMRGNLFTAWVYSAAIGTLCWLFIDGGRLLLARLLPGRQHQPSAERSRWPGPLWMLGCILVGSALGYSGGSAVGDAITGFSTPSLLHNRTAMIVSMISAVAATWYFKATEKLNLAQAAAEAARRAAAESQLKLLQSQLEPHMLFNTLANLRVLITLDPPRAQEMLDRLISYLRATLGASRAGQHALSAEFDRLADYLALMAVRMGPRLQVALHLPDELRGLPVPPLLLQPLVENSIRHGLEPKVSGGRIEVRATRQGERLVLSVRDTGVGLPAACNTSGAPGEPASGSSYGTRHVTERLATLYGEQARFHLAAAADAEGGTLAEVSLPLPRTTAAPTLADTAPPAG